MNLFSKVFCFLCLIAATSAASAEALNAFSEGVQNGLFSEVDIAHYLSFSPVYRLIPLLVFIWIVFTGFIVADDYDRSLKSVAVIVVFSLGSLAVGCFGVWGAEQLFVGEHAAALKLADASMQIQRLEAFSTGIEKGLFTLEDVSHYLLAQPFFRFFWAFVLAGIVIPLTVGCFKPYINVWQFTVVILCGLFLVRSYLIYVYVGVPYDALKEAALINMAQVVLK